MSRNGQKSEIDPVDCGTRSTEEGKFTVKPRQFDKLTFATIVLETVVTREIEMSQHTTHRVFSIDVLIPLFILAELKDFIHTVCHHGSSAR